MERSEEVVQKEMRSLIDISCQFANRPKEEFCTFHKAYLKFSFNAVALEIDYKAKQITSSNPRPLTTNPVRLFEMNKALVDKLSYSNLKETLAGCLKKGPLYQHFYETLLSEYADTSITDSDNSSA